MGKSRWVHLGLNPVRKQWRASSIGEEFYLERTLADGLTGPDKNVLLHCSERKIRAVAKNLNTLTDVLT